MLALAAFMLAMVPIEHAFAANVSARDGKLVVDGKPFFPFGFFANVGDPMRDLEAVGTNGFNAIHCNNKCDDAYYARAAQLGVYVIQEIWWPDPEASVQSSRNKSPVIAYYVADDMNYKGSCALPQYTPAQIGARSSLIRSYDVAAPAAHPTTGALVLAPECTILEYADSVDILQGFSYPIENWDSPSTWLERNAQAIKMLVAAGGSHKPVIADSQSFGWPGKRVPTPSESRNMNYAALALGVSGIMMYTLSDPDGFYLPHDAPDLWQELKTQAMEAQRLFDILLNGARTPLQAGEHNIYASAWTQGARMLVIVVNTDRVNTRTVDLQLPAGSNTRLKPPFPRYRTRLVSSEGALSGHIQPEGVQVLFSVE
jgi:hypothetical protein